jgi:4-hydroxybenzoate polyprenyltransferase
VKLILRTSMACLAVGLTASACRLAELPVSLPMLASVFFLSCAARLQNDWRDRHQDIKRGKVFASSHQRLFLLCLLSCWAVCCLLIAVTAYHNGISALLLTTAALAGLLYSETRKVPWLPISLAAITSAGPTFLPSTLEPNAARMLPLFAAAALLIFGREILMDLRDKEYDGDYKWTIPLAYGDRAAKWLAIVSIAGACIAIVTISPLAIGGVLVAGKGLMLFYRNASPVTTMNWLDMGAALVIAALVTFPPLPNPLA